MLTVIHTFNGPDRNRILADIEHGLETVEGIEGFKFASVNQQTNTDDIMVFSKWQDEAAYQAWADAISQNWGFRQSTPQIFEVLDEKY